MENTTPTPIIWKVKEQHNGLFCIMTNNDSGICGNLFESEAKRIVECVNALAGIDDPKEYLKHLRFNANNANNIQQEYDDFRDGVEKLSIKHSFKIESVEVENDQLKSEILNLKAELKAAKCEGWDEGFNEGVSYGESEKNTRHNNPYKG